MRPRDFAPPSSSRFLFGLSTSYVLLYRAMACPYFYPVARFENSPWSIPPRLPLGDAFSGECRAPGSTLQPDETRMREVCNSGYGRHSCEQFPSGSGADAIRFHVAKDAGKLIQIQYVFEKDCWPVQHGTLDCSTADCDTTRESSQLAAEILRRQADAFVESYLRRRG
jgi:hypothetical protein